MFLNFVKELNPKDMLNVNEFLAKQAEPNKHLFTPQFRLAISDLPQLLKGNASGGDSPRAWRM